MITIFVSSTFRDMQAERDMLSERVLPEIREYARKHGKSVSFIDLRWGIDTSAMETEEGAQKVLSVCLDEIKKSRPYLITFIGERYGMIPSEKLMRTAIKPRKKEGFSLDDLEKSITELEIEFGAFSKEGQPERCLFYYRNPLPREVMGEKDREAYLPESEVHAEKLRKLKARIEKLAGGSVRQYSCTWDSAAGIVTGLDELEDMIIRDLKALLEERFGAEKQLSWQEMEMRDARLYFSQKAELCSARSEDFKGYAKDMYEGGTNLLVVQGTRGSGKSTAMGSIAGALEEMKCKVMPFACGRSGGSSTASDIVKQAVYFMEDLLGREERFGAPGPDGKERTLEEWSQAWEGLLYEYSRKRRTRVAFVIDAMDQLVRDDASEKMLWLPALPKGISIAVSCLDTFRLPMSLDGREKVRRVSLGQMDEDDRRKVLGSLDV